MTALETRNRKSDRALSSELYQKSSQNASFAEHLHYAITFAGLNPLWICPRTEGIFVLSFPTAIIFKIFLEEGQNY